MARMLSGRCCMAAAPCTLLLLCILQGTRAETQDCATLLGSLINIGETVLQAGEAYEKLADIYRAKGLVKVHNFLNQSLTQCTVIETQGATKSTISITIASGYEEGFAAQQNKIGQGVEMIWSCRVTLPSGQKLRLFVQFKMRQQGSDRKPNNLGVAILEDNDGDLLEDERYKSLIGDSKPFYGPLQCATDDIAVQTTMSTSHQSEIDINVYPKLIENFAGSMQPARRVKAGSQKDLDDLLNFKQSCLNGSYIDKYKGLTTRKIHGIIGTAVIFIILVGISCYCGYGRRPCSCCSYNRHHCC